MRTRHHPSSEPAVFSGSRRITTLRAIWWRVWRAMVVAAACLAGAIGGGAADDLEALLERGEVKRITNPVASTFFAEQVAAGLPPELVKRVAEQLLVSLRRQTSPIVLMMDSALGLQGGRTTGEVMDRMGEVARPQGIAKQVIGGALGVQAPMPQITPRESQAMERERIQGFADPWIRGAEAARAMARMGDAQAAGRFYVNCIQIVSADWMKDGALQGILALGPRRAFALLTWMAESAEDISFSTVTETPRRGKNDAPDMGTLAVRGAALRGLGALVGAGALGSEERTAALATLLRYGAGDTNAYYFADAATGLGRTADASALPSLQRLARWRKDERVAPAADAGLAIFFHDAAASQRLRRDLSVKNEEDTLRVLPSLLEAGDSETLEWSVRVITGRRAMEDKRPDLRPQVVRELVVAPQGRGFPALTRAVTEGAGNDWLQAWVQLALLETGDTTRLATVQADLDRTDWKLDRPGLKYYWSRIQPYVNLAVGAALGQPVSPKQIAQVIANTAMQELAQRRAHASDRELVSMQYRFQAATVLGGVDDPAAVALLRRLLDNEELAVRMSAAASLAASPNAAALDGIVPAFALNFGTENGVPRGPEIRAALVRSAVLRFPHDPRTRALCQTATADADPGVRFIALVALSRP